MAIGLNANDISVLVAKQQKKIKELENIANSYEERLLALEKGTIYTPSSDVADTSIGIAAPAHIKEITRQEIIAAQMPPELSDDIMKEAMVYLETEYKRRVD